MSEGSKEFCWVVVLGRKTLHSSSQVDLVAFRRIERTSMKMTFSKTMSVRIKIRSLPPKMLFQSFRTVTYPATNEELSAFCSFDSWITKKLINFRVDK